MKRLLLSLSILFSVAALQASQRQYDWVAGAKMGVYSRWDGTFGIGAYARYGLTDHLRVEPSLLYLCRKGMSIDFNADIQYALIVSERAEIFPLVGLAVNDPGKWGVGLNLGGGVNIINTSAWDFTGSVKWVLQSQKGLNNPIVFSIGANYKF